MTAGTLIIKPGSCPPRAIGKSERRPLRALVLLCVFALMNCAWSVQKNLPFEVLENEPGLAMRIMRIILTGDLNPHWLHHPASPYTYMLACIYSFFMNLGAVPRPLLSGINGIANAPGRYYCIPDLVPFFLTGRLLNCLFYAATVPLMYYMGKEVFSKRAGLIAAFFFVTCPFLLVTAQIVLPEALNIFQVAVCLSLLLRLSNAANLRRVVWAGVVVGLALASKWSNVVLLPLLAIAVFRLPLSLRQKAQMCSIGLLVACLSFLAAVPFLFFNSDRLLHDLSWVLWHWNTLKEGPSPPLHLFSFLTLTIPRALSPGLAALSLAGIVSCLRRQTSKQNVLLLFVVFYLMQISASHLYHDRWCGPVLPILMIMSAHFIELIAGNITGRFLMAGAKEGLLVLFAALLVVAPNLRNLISLQMLAVFHNSALQSRQWMIENLPQGCKIIETEWSAPLIGAGFDATVDYHHLVGFTTPERLANQGFRYFVTSSTVEKVFFADAAQYKNQCLFYARLLKCQLVHEFKPPYSTSFISWEQDPSPTIRIYRLPDSDRSREDIGPKAPARKGEK